jgi:hypothetical protein
MVGRAVLTAIALAACTLSISPKLTLAAGQKAAKIEIAVMDESNQAVIADVFLNDGSKPVPLPIKMHANGPFQIEYKCAVGQTFYAVPTDLVSYFKSAAEVCEEHVRLIAPHRMTAQGPASIISVKSAIADNGLEFLFFVKGGYEKNVKDLANDGSGDTRCAVSFAPIVSTEIYKIEPKGSWKKLIQVSTYDDLAISNVAKTEYIFNKDCNASKPQIFETEKSVSSSVDFAIKRVAADRADLAVKGMKPDQ